MVASTPQERFDALNRISAEIITRKDELGRLLAREEGGRLCRRASARSPARRPRKS